MNTKFPVELLTEIGREGAASLLKNEGWWLQKKLDGHRRQFELFADGTLLSYNRNGESVSYPNELAGAFARLKWKTFVIDGELVGDVFFAFDLLQRNGCVIAPKTYNERFSELVLEFGNRLPSGALVRLTPTFFTTKTKTAALADYYKSRAEGVVFRRISAPYRAGRCDQHFKYKFTKTASCIVTAVGKFGKASMDLALADLETCKLVSVGSCSIRKEWPRPGSVVEVRYLYATEAMRLYQPVFMRIRADQNPRDCTMEQLQFKEGFGLKEKSVDR